MTIPNPGSDETKDASAQFLIMLTGEATTRVVYNMDCPLHQPEETEDAETNC